MRTLFLQAPSFDGFDGGAGVALPGAPRNPLLLVPDLARAGRGLRPGQQAHRRGAASAPAGRRGARRTQLRPRGIAYVDAFVRVRRRGRRSAEVGESAPEGRFRRGEGRGRAAGEPRASEAVDFVAGNEFDFTIKEVAEGRDWRSIAGLSYRDDAGAIRHNPPRAVLENMDELPFVTPVYKRDLKIENYFIGYLKHPYVSLYTGRGCKSRCTFCLWPQTVGGHRYRTRSVGHVVEEIRWAKAALPQVKEFFFDDDTFTDDRPRAEAIARELGKLGVTWSCNAKANVPRATLEGDARQRPAAAARRLRNRQSADPAQHQEGHARRRGAALHQGLPRPRHHHPRHLHSRPARRDPGDHRGDHPLRQGDQSAHDPGLAGGALSGHRALPRGARARLARYRTCRARRRRAACRSRRCTTRI